MLADVAQAGGAEQGVGDGVKQRIGIGMAEEALIEGDIHSPQDEPTALHQLMDVIALAHPNVQSAHRLPRKIHSATPRSAG